MEAGIPRAAATRGNDIWVFGAEKRANLLLRCVVVLLEQIFHIGAAQHLDEADLILGIQIDDELALHRLQLHEMPGSPVIGMSDPVEHLTQFVVAVQRWSDGTEIAKP